MTERNATSETMHALSRQWGIDHNSRYSAEGKLILFDKLHKIVLLKRKYIVESGPKAKETEMATHLAFCNIQRYTYHSITGSFVKHNHISVMIRGIRISAVV